MSCCSEFNFSEDTCPCTQVDVGKDYCRVLRYRVKATKKAIDITGYTFVMTIKDALGGTTLLTLNVTTTPNTTGLYIPDPSTGIITIYITDTDTTATGGGTFPYQIDVTDPSGKEEIFMKGTIQFLDRGF